MRTQPERSSRATDPKYAPDEDARAAYLDLKKLSGSSSRICRKRLDRTSRQERLQHLLERILVQQENSEILIKEFHSLAGLETELNNALNEKADLESTAEKQVVELNSTKEQLAMFTIENAKLKSQVEILERDVTGRGVMITKLHESLKYHRNETAKARDSLEDWSKKYLCCICVDTKADILTECGHLFCERCLITWENEWATKTNPYGDVKEALKGVSTCPTCKGWIVASRVRRIYI